MKNFFNCHFFSFSIPHFSIVWLFDIIIVLFHKSCLKKLKPVQKSFQSFLFPNKAHWLSRPDLIIVLLLSLLAECSDQNCAPQLGQVFEESLPSGENLMSAYEKKLIFNFIMKRKMIKRWSEIVQGKMIDLKKCLSEFLVQIRLVWIWKIVWRKRID